MRRRRPFFWFLVGFLIVVMLPCTSFAGNTATSGINAQTLIDRVIRDMNGVTGYCSNDDLLQWLNDAIREVVDQTRCLEAAIATITVTSARSYSLASISSWIDIEKVEFDSGVTWIQSDGGTTRFNSNYVYDLDRVRFIALREGNEKEIGNPKAFAVWNNALYIWPPPSPYLAGTSLYVYYVPAPSGVTTASSPIETPAYFDSALRDYVRAQAHYKDLQKTEGDLFLTRFYGRIKTYLVNVLRRNVFSIPVENQTQTPANQ